MRRLGKQVETDAHKGFHPTQKELNYLATKIFRKNGHSFCPGGTCYFLIGHHPGSITMENLLTLSKKIINNFATPQKEATVKLYTAIQKHLGIKPTFPTQELSPGSHYPILKK